MVRRALHVLDGDRLVHDARDAGALAGRRAHAPRELGKVVGAREIDVRVLPLVLEDEVVELGDDVADRAAGVRHAKGRAAIHAPCCLPLELERLMLRVDLFVVLEPAFWWSVRLWVALIINEATQLVDRSNSAVAALDLHRRGENSTSPVHKAPQPAGWRQPHG